MRKRLWLEAYVELDRIIVEGHQWLDYISWYLKMNNASMLRAHGLKWQLLCRNACIWRKMIDSFTSLNFYV